MVTLQQKIHHAMSNSRGVDHLFLGEPWIIMDVHLGLLIDL